jgi:hypothetical protein
MDRCKYCNKLVKVMPDHLNKNKECSRKHGTELLVQLKNVIILNLKRGQNENT